MPPSPARPWPCRDPTALRLLVVRAFAALGRREAAALGGDRPTLHAVRGRYLEVDDLLGVELAVALLQLLEDLLGHLVHLRRAHLLPHERELERHLALDADVRRRVVAGLVAR